MKNPIPQIHQTKHTAKGTETTTYLSEKEKLPVYKENR
jgi:hypothetical protein